MQGCCSAHRRRLCILQRPLLRPPSVTRGPQVLGPGRLQEGGTRAECRAVAIRAHPRHQGGLRLVATEYVAFPTPPSGHNPIPPIHTTLRRHIATAQEGMAGSQLRAGTF